MSHELPIVSPLRQRMIDDMNMRKLTHKTQKAYIRAVKNSLIFLAIPRFRQPRMISANSNFT